MPKQTLNTTDTVVRYYIFYFFRKENLATQSGPDRRTTQDTPTENSRQGAGAAWQALRPPSKGGRGTAPGAAIGEGGAGVFCLCVLEQVRGRVMRKVFILITA